MFRSHLIEESSPQLSLEPPLLTSYTYGVLIVASQEVSAVIETIATFL